ncbi:MAG: hypothetical protein AAFV77_12840 [Planctomycetota bacterium]
MDQPARLAQAVDDQLIKTELPQLALADHTNGQANHMPSADRETEAADILFVLSTRGDLERPQINGLAACEGARLRGTSNRSLKDGAARYGEAARGSLGGWAHAAHDHGWRNRAGLWLESMQDLSRHVGKGAIDAPLRTRRKERDGPKQPLGVRIRASVCSDAQAGGRVGMVRREQRHATAKPSQFLLEAIEELAFHSTLERTENSLKTSIRGRRLGLIRCPSIAFTACPERLQCPLCDQHGGFSGSIREPISPSCRG